MLPLSPPGSQLEDILTKFAKQTSHDAWFHSDPPIFLLLLLLLGNDLLRLGWNWKVQLVPRILGRIFAPHPSLLWSGYTPQSKGIFYPKVLCGSMSFSQKQIGRMAFGQHWISKDLLTKWKKVLASTILVSTEYLSAKWFLTKGRGIVQAPLPTQSFISKRKSLVSKM